jgi:hypothetical protein
VHGRWLHVQRMERWWQLVSNVGREVAGGRAAVARARSQPGRRLEASLTGGGMGGAWSSRGSRDTRRRQRREAGSGRNSSGSARCRAERGQKTSAIRNRLGRYCSTGSSPIRCTVSFCNYSNFASISKYKVKTILTSKIIETWHGARVDPSKQFLSLGPLPILNIIQFIKFGTTSTLNFSLNF